MTVLSDREVDLELAAQPGWLDEHHPEAANRS